MDPRTGRPFVVLVVDDDPDVYDVIADALGGEDYDVRRAYNGAEALERIRSGYPDLILLNLLMPVMDGWQFCRALRSMEPARGIPVVLLSGISDLATAAAELQARHALAKPFDLDELLEAVSSCRREGTAGL